MPSKGETIMTSAEQADPGREEKDQVVRVRHRRYDRRSFALTKMT
jgi:hypothetical protein